MLNKVFRYGFCATLSWMALTLSAGQGWSFSGPIQGYYRYPTVHGKKVVFSAEGDLWSVSTQGGVAQRLTSHAGPEVMPRFSPDGKWIAFSAYYGGDMDVYVMPAQGGVPKRLTFRAGPEIVVGWLPNSKGVIFRSLRTTSNREWRLFSVGLQAKGLPTLLPVGHGSAISFSKSGHRVAFTRYARETRTWKRYLGGWAQDIWMGSVKTRIYRKITRFPGTDAFPMWYKKRIYFLSDRTGERNIFSIQPNGKGLLQHTHHTGWDARWPSLGQDSIVYQRGADIWCLDLKTNRTRKVSIALPTDASQRRKRWVFYRHYAKWFDIGPKGKRLLINARGRVFNIPVKKGVSFQLNRSSSFRTKFATFSPDGASVIAMSDKTGEDEVTILDAMGEKPIRVLTKGSKAYRFWPVVSPNGKWVAFSDKNFILWIASIKTGKLTRVGQSRNWEIRHYTWSPDSRYLAYVNPERNSMSSIFIFDAKKKKTIRATTRWTHDFSPAWSKDGKRLYFLSNRTINPFFSEFDFIDVVNKSTKIYALELTKKKNVQFRSMDDMVQRRNVAERKAAKKAKKTKSKTKVKAKSKAKAKSKSKKAKKAKKASKENKAKAKSKNVKKASKTKKVSKKKKCKKRGRKGCKKSIRVQIDVKGLLQRVYPLPGVPAGRYAGLTALAKKLIVLSIPTRRIKDRRRALRATLMAYGFKARKLRPWIRGISSYSVSKNGRFIAIRQGRAFRVFSVRARRAPKGRRGLVRLKGMKAWIRPMAEWRQMFIENWRWQRDFFWAPNMVGLNWKAVLKRYLPLLSRMLTRSDLNDLIGELIGELGTSHTYVWGGARSRFTYVRNGVLGADFAVDAKHKLYRIQKVFRGAFWSQASASPLAAAHLGIQKGTYILTIDGKKLTSSDNVFEALQGKANQLLVLRVNNRPTLKGSRRIVVRAITWRKERELRYIDWVESRRKLADKLSGGKVAYIHLPNMSAAGLVAFYKMWFPQLHKRAMIIDVRCNGGGFVSQLILQRLMRRVWSFFKARNAPKSMRNPDKTFHGHLAVLADARTASDGDIFSQTFQINKLGPVIGTRTWGGVVGIRADKRFVDGGLTTQPEYAWWSHHRKIGWKLENLGVKPDIYVDNTPNDVVRNRDKQLQRGVQYLLKRLKKNPKTLPAMPPYPNKSIRAFRKRMKKWQAPAAPIQKQKK